jgi:hypothetical protein
MEQPTYVDVRAFAEAVSFLLRFHQSSMDSFDALQCSRGEEDFEA